MSFASLASSVVVCVVYMCYYMFANKERKRTFFGLLLGVCVVYVVVFSYVVCHMSITSLCGVVGLLHLLHLCLLCCYVSSLM